MSSKDVGKKAAACAAIDKYIKNDQKVGIGSGSTIIYAVERLAHMVLSQNLNVLCAPTSFQAKSLILEYKLPLISLEEHTELDICFDGADEIDSNLCLIKGGGGCHLQEKIVASAARQLIIMADASKDSSHLGDKWTRGIPIEVVVIAHAVVKDQIEKKFGGEANLRQAVNKMGPIVTDSGNFILDWKFPGKIEDSCHWKAIDTELHMIPGVVETGLFINMAQEVFFGRSDGTVYSRKSEQ